MDAGVEQRRTTPWKEEVERLRRQSRAVAESGWQKIAPDHMDVGDGFTGWTPVYY
jgi:hypothetical protein